VFTQTLPSPPPCAAVSGTLYVDFDPDFGADKGFSPSPGDASRPVAVMGFGTVLFGAGFVAGAVPGLCAKAATENARAILNPNAFN
jgi:hypothetical protein